MKRSGASAASKTGARARRLIERLPLVYVGPDAVEGLGAGAGLLLGAQRPGWVDVLSCFPASRRNWKKLVERRFDYRGEWSAVGIALEETRFLRARPRLVAELVPGDVVLVLGENRPPVRAYVNAGDRLAPTRLKVGGSARRVPYCFSST